MDFMSDQLFQGQRFRLLTLVDNFTRESLAVEVGQRLKGDDVGKVLERVSQGRETPQAIRVDNGPEFISRSLDLWAYWNGVKLDFSRPGKPTDNAFIESFNGKLRQECLNQHWFLSLEDAAKKVECWRREYNQQRPHRALGNVPPMEFATSARALLTGLAPPIRFCLRSASLGGEGRGDSGRGIGQALRSWKTHLPSGPDMGQVQKAEELT